MSTVKTRRHSSSATTADQQRKMLALGKLQERGWEPVLMRLALAGDHAAINGQYWSKVRHTCGHTLAWTEEIDQAYHEAKCARSTLIHQLHAMTRLAQKMNGEFSALTELISLAMGDLSADLCAKCASMFSAFAKSQRSSANGLDVIAAGFRHVAAQGTDDRPAV